MAATRFPSATQVARELRAVNAEADGDMDVRLQVYPNGDWYIRTGDASYDQDHRGFWGAGSVPGRRRRFNASDEAKRLLDEAKDQEYAERNYGGQSGRRRTEVRRAAGVVTSKRCREPGTGQFAPCEDRGERLGFARPTRVPVRGSSRNRNTGGIKRNREGLSWVEWLRAAGVSESDLSFENMPDDRLRMLRGAWEAGEDPSEYRAALTARRGRGDGGRRTSRSNRQSGGGSCGCS